MNFQEAVYKHFKFTGRAFRDNLPALAIPKFHWGNQGDHGRQALARVASDMQCRRGVEIGTHRGDSSIMWLKQAKKMHLSCIDPYVTYNARRSQNAQNAVYAEAVERLKPYNAEIIRAASLDVVDSFEDRSLDFLYIDGDHEFDPVVQDLVRWAPKVCKGGLILLHDYGVFWRGGVVKAVDAYTSCHRIDPWYVTRDYMPTAFWEKRICHE
uniref:Putative methyltransferase n=1 Tax=viral metagenome TaxID=1070528 RepID=A0A6M3L3E3_9ZZZZ